MANDVTLKMARRSYNKMTKVTSIFKISIFKHILYSNHGNENGRSCHLGDSKHYWTITVIPPATGVLGILTSARGRGTGGRVRFGDGGGWGGGRSGGWFHNRLLGMELTTIDSINGEFGVRSKEGLIYVLYARTVCTCFIKRVKLRSIVHIRIGSSAIGVFVLQNCYSWRIADGNFLRCFMSSFALNLHTANLWWKLIINICATLVVKILGFEMSEGCHFRI